LVSESPENSGVHDLGAVETKIDPEKSNKNQNESNKRKYNNKKPWA
jgi:hypothetical protein